MARLWTCGWESGYANGTGAGSDECHPLGWGGATSGSTVVANPAWWQSAGSYVLRNTAPGNRNPLFATHTWVGFKFGLDAYPSGEQDVFFLSGSGLSFTANPNGVVHVWMTSTGGIVYTSPASTLKVKTCHLIEIKATSGDQQFWLDGVLLFSYASTNAGDAFATSPNFVLGGDAAIFYFDDFYANSATASASNQTGRRGAASVRALVPNRDVGSSPAGFTNSGSLTFGNATTGWFSAVDDAPPFLAANADFIGKSTVSTVVYEMGFAASPGGVAPTSVQVVPIVGAASAAAAQVNVSVKANATDGASLSLAPAVTTPLIGSFAVDVPSSGVAWTKALLDAVTVKFGSSTDVTPNPKLFASYLMFETLDKPAISTLQDTFATTVDKTTTWPDSSAATVWDSSGRAKIPCTTLYPSLSTSGAIPGYNLTGSALYAKLTVPATGTGTREMFMEVISGTGSANKLSMFVSGGTLFGRRTIAGATSGQLSVTYDPFAHAWWRIRESLGTVYFDFSADGITWTNHWSTAPGMPITACWVNFDCGYYGTEAAADGFVDNVNVAIPPVAQSVQVPGCYPPGFVASICGVTLCGTNVALGTPGTQFGTVTAKFGSPQSKAVTGVSSAQAFGAIKTNLGRPVGGVPSAQAFGVPSAKATITRAVGGVSSAQALGAPTIKTTVRPGVGSVPSAQAFGTVTPIVTGGGTQIVAVAGRGTAQAFGTPTVKATFKVAPAGLGSAQAFGSVTAIAVAPPQTKVVSGVASAQAFGTVRSRLSAPVGGVPSAQAFGVPRTRVSFTVGSVGSAQAFGTPHAITVQRLTVPGVESAQAFGEPWVGHLYLHPAKCLSSPNPAICGLAICGETVCGGASYTDESDSIDMLLAGISEQFEDLVVAACLQSPVPAICGLVLCGEAVCGGHSFTTASVPLVLDLQPSGC